MLGKKLLFSPRPSPSSCWLVGWLDGLFFLFQFRLLVNTSLCIAHFDGDNTRGRRTNEMKWNITKQKINHLSHRDGKKKNSGNYTIEANRTTYKRKRLQINKRTNKNIKWFANCELWIVCITNGNNWVKKKNQTEGPPRRVTGLHSHTTTQLHAHSCYSVTCDNLDRLQCFSVVLFLVLTTDIDGARWISVDSIRAERLVHCIFPLNYYN